MEWEIYNMCLRHKRYGTFWTYPGHGAGEVTASRCYQPAPEQAFENEALGDHASLAEAQAAVAKRIAELDAHAVPEQLEACR
jgi:hypothetical protein